MPTGKDDIREVPYPNFLDFEEAFNSVGYEGGVEFRNGKKPVDFIKFLFSIGTTNKNAVILDFFAGSGSTGHAVMEQNYIDGGRRQVILCTNNENNIANEVTYPRIKNLINGYIQTKNHKVLLYELTLNPKNISDNTAILEAKEKFFSDAFKAYFDEVREEVRKNHYSLYGMIKKSSPVKGYGGSLTYYQTAFIGANH